MFWHDVRLALLSIRRTPFIAGVIVAVIAVGIAGLYPAWRIAHLPRDPAASESALKSAILGVVKQVAAELRNTPAVRLAHVAVTRSRGRLH